MEAPDFQSTKWILSRFAQTHREQYPQENAIN
jgi:hypothetical protein